MSTSNVREGLARVRNGVVHVQLPNDNGGYDKFDVDPTDALVDYIESEQESGRTHLSLAGAGNSADYVTVFVAERDVVTTTHVRQVLVPVVSSDED